MSIEGKRGWLAGYIERYLTASHQLQKVFASKRILGYFRLCVNR